MALFFAPKILSPQALESCILTGKLQPALWGGQIVEKSTQKKVAEGKSPSWLWLGGGIKLQPPLSSQPPNCTVPLCLDETDRFWDQNSGNSVPSEAQDLTCGPLGPHRSYLQEENAPGIVKCGHAACHFGPVWDPKKSKSCDPTSRILTS